MTETQDWPAPDNHRHDTALSGLSVSAIMTPRSDFKTVRSSQLIEDVSDEVKDTFDYIPVLPHEGLSIIGTLRPQAIGECAPGTNVKARTERLHEGIVVSADLPIISFMKNALDHELVYVVGDAGILGLVHISDLQKLPVRVALFGVVTSLETLLSEALAQRLRTENGAVEEAITKSGTPCLAQRVVSAKQKDNYVSWPLLLTFSEKILTAKPLGLRRDVADELDRWRNDVRNNLVHGLDFAASPETARSVCELVSKVGVLHDDIRRCLFDDR